MPAYGDAAAGGDGAKVLGYMPLPAAGLGSLSWRKVEKKFRCSESSLGLHWVTPKLLALARQSCCTSEESSQVAGR